MKPALVLFVILVMGCSSPPLPENHYDFYLSTCYSNSDTCEVLSLDSNSFAHIIPTLAQLSDSLRMEFPANAKATLGKGDSAIWIPTFNKGTWKREGDTTIIFYNWQFTSNSIPISIQAKVFINSSHSYEIWIPKGNDTLRWIYVDLAYHE